MTINWKKIGIAAAMAATALTTANTASARDRYYHRGNGDTAAIAIGAGIIGLAVGAAIADRGDDRYYDRRYYSSRRYVRVDGYPGYYYYYQGAPNRYYRDRYYDRYYGSTYGRSYGRHDNRWNRNRHYDNRWDRDGRRGERHHDRDDRRHWHR